MSVGGTIVGIRRKTLDDGQEVIQFTVIDRAYTYDVTSVYAQPQAIMPGMRQQIWWHGRTIYFDDDRQTMVRVGYSFGGWGSDSE